MYILAEPLSLLIRPIYEFTGNYGWTLVIVTILINLLTIPLTLMSQKSMARTQQLQPLMQELQKKYKNDKEKLNLEMQKLYTKYNVNPMSGCLPMIVRLLVLFGFIGVIYNPLKYILQLSADDIKNITETVAEIAKVKASSIPYQVQVCGMEGAAEAITALGKTPINFNFMGIDLTKMLKANLKDISERIIPVLAVLATVMSSFVTKKLTAAKNGSAANDQAAAMNNSMIMIMPVMTAYFTFIMPIGMSLYWFTSTIVNVLQQFVVNFIVKKSGEEIPLTAKDKKLMKK